MGTEQRSGGKPGLFDTFGIAASPGPFGLELLLG
jgi:hypothetical protein